MRKLSRDLFLLESVDGGCTPDFLPQRGVGLEKVVVVAQILSFNGFLCISTAPAFNCRLLYTFLRVSQ